MIAVFGFAGLTLRLDGLAIKPRLPAGWATLAFRCQWRGRHLKICIDGSSNPSIISSKESLCLFLRQYLKYYCIH